MDGKTFIQKPKVYALFSLSPNFYAFLGGVFISVAVNLYTGVFAADILTSRWVIVLSSAVLAFVSGIFWSMIAWNLETINRLAITQSPEFVDEQKVWRKLIQIKLARLIFYLVSAFSCAAISSIILLV